MVSRRLSRRFSKFLRASLRFALAQAVFSSRVDHRIILALGYSIFSSRVTVKKIEVRSRIQFRGSATHRPAPASRRLIPEPSELQTDIDVRRCEQCDCGAQTGASELGGQKRTRRWRHIGYRSLAGRGSGSRGSWDCALILISIVPFRLFHELNV